LLRKIEEIFATPVIIAGIVVNSNKLLPEFIAGIVNTSD
jgi:hypothetical protein